jgi:hypothetical protein
MLDRILEVGRNEHGLFYDAIDPVDGTVVRKHLADTWGYTFNGFYTVYLIDGTEAYRTATRRALAEGLPLHLKAGEPLGIRVIGAEAGE